MSLNETPVETRQSAQRCYVIVTASSYREPKLDSPGRPPFRPFRLSLSARDKCQHDSVQALSIRPLRELADCDKRVSSRDHDQWPLFSNVDNVSNVE